MHIQLGGTDLRVSRGSADRRNECAAIAGALCPRVHSRPISGGLAAECVADGQARTRSHQGDGICAIFPDRLQHRSFRTGAGHTLPGPGVGRELGDLLHPRDHVDRSGNERPPVRALRVQGAQRTAGHRRGLRAPAPRGSDPVDLQDLWSRPRCSRVHRHSLSGEGRYPRRRKSDGSPRGRDQSSVIRPVVVVGRSDGAQCARAEPQSGRLPFS